MNIQYRMIGIDLVGFILLFFVLRKGIVLNGKCAVPASVGASLIFEFLNLVLHPYMGEPTHHSPTQRPGLMVLIVSILASFIIAWKNGLEQLDHPE